MEKLSEKIRFVSLIHKKRINENKYQEVIRIKDIKRLITEIQVKILMDWKGQNKFVDWLNERVGNELSGCYKEKEDKVNA